MEDNQSDRYRACLELYKKNGGKNLSQIERDMRSIGYIDFHRRILYGRTENGIYKPGWIEKFGWKEHLLPAPPLDVRKGYSFPKHLLKNSGGYASGPAGGGVAVDHVSGLAEKAQPFRTSNGQSPKEGFEAWLKRVSPELTWDWRYQEYIYKQLEKVTSGACKRMMIFMPPRHGKSELVTVRYAGWRLWNDPAMRIIVSSYNQRLADRFSRSIRRVLSKEEDKQMGNADCGVRNEDVPSPPNGSRGAVRKRAPAEYPQCTSDTSKRSEIANRNSQITRMFPPSRTINTASQWETALGGGVKAVGVGAGVTGFGAQLIVIDDPIKNRAEAESETYREKTWDWYRNDIYTRLEPNGAIVLIQTRWHEDDLAGRLLRDMQDGGDQWEVIDLPALAEPRPVATGLLSLKGTKIIAQGKAESRDPGIECTLDSDPVGVESANIEVAPLQGTNNSSIVPGATLVSLAHPRLLSSSPSATEITDPLGRPAGAALCPQRFDEGALDEIKRQLGSYAFSALYQQRPTPADGGIFKLAWFNRFVDRAPEGLIWKRGYDLAVSTKTSACYTSSFRVAYDEAGNLYIADGFRKRLEYPDQRRYIVSRLLAEPDTEHGIEKALHGEAIIQDIRQEKKIRGSNLKGVTVTADKLTRALKWAPLAEEGKLILVRGPWNREFIEEVCQFPGGKFDDQVDAVSLAVTMFRRQPKRLVTLD